MKRLILALCIWGVLIAGSAYSQPTDLFFSEYIEGSSFNKALEIYNGTGVAIDLSAGNYKILIYFNGSTTAGNTILLSGTIADGDVYVVADASADAAILAVTDQISTSNFYNGDDAVALVKDGVIIDVIGQIGFDPGSQWGSGDSSTQNHTLRRKSAVCQGDNDGGDAFDPAIEWDGLAQDTFDGLGTHTASCASIPIVINEVDADNLSTDAAEFVEIYDGGVGNTALDGQVIVFFNGNGDASYAAFDLDGQSTGDDGYFVLCGNAANVANCDFDLSPDTNLIQNGADAVALYVGDASDFPNGTPVTTVGIIDAIVYDTDNGDDAGLLILLNASQPQVNERGGGDGTGHSSQRCPDGSGGARNTDTYAQFPPTPGAENTCVIGDEFGQCGDPATFIHDIQGNGASSPEQGNIHVIEGMVVGDFQDVSTGLRGFFVQEEDSDVDADPTTSEGIFVFDNGFGVDVMMGDLVRVMGTVTEYFGLTELTDISNVAVCSTGGNASAAIVDLPVSSLDVWERYEGMSINFLQTLYATDNFTAGRYGEVELSVVDRLYAPTNIVAPGAPALALQDINDRSRIQMDDGSTVQNPDPAPYLSSDNTLRAGDTLAGLSGVLGYAFGVYEVHPTEVVNFTRVNNRDPIPPSAGGTLKVASFNVLNYFTTLDGSGPICGPTESLDCRGADTAEEFTRQRDKIISAILAMDADVIGLMELENHPADTALQNLVNGLNDSAGAGMYSLIPTGPMGTDAIKVAFIYKPGKVTPAGPYAVLDTSVDPTFLDTKNRPALAQTFQQNANGEKFTVAVNHFKSKGSPCNDVGDPDTGDGQGNCNLTRTSAAIALVNWLATDPTGSDDADFLIIGDLNAYAMEDPITAIKASGYSNLIEQFIDDAYSFVFFGQAGYLDHALATGSLAPQVTDVTIWHINADEPSALDYNNYNQASLYKPDSYRSSDHDPVIVGLAINAPPNCSEATPSMDLLWPPNHKLVSIEILGVTDPDGDAVTVTIDSIFQDEPVNSQGDGNTAPDGMGIGEAEALIRKERQGSGNGRVYHIEYTADDGQGGFCSGEVLVGVPKSMGRKWRVPVDDGALFDSTVGSAEAVEDNSKNDPDSEARPKKHRGRPWTRWFWRR